MFLQTATGNTEGVEDRLQQILPDFALIRVVFDQHRVTLQLDVDSDEVPWAVGTIPALSDHSALRVVVTEAAQPFRCFADDEVDEAPL